MARANSPVITWSGNEALRRTLIPVGELHPHPRNPRRGVVDEIARSLRRFGQQRPVLALPDGTIVAGHHVWQAAAAEGWSHVAVVHSDLPPAEVDAYLLADNRLADLGIYDDAELAGLLAPLAEAGGLEGTGYIEADLDALLAYLEPPQLDKQEQKRPEAYPYAVGSAVLFRIMLTYDRETYEALIGRLDALADRYGLDSYSEVIDHVVSDAAA